MIADVTGVHRHIMLREYNKVKNPDDGEWPQFRSNKLGRCPFVLDPDTKALLKQQQIEEEMRKREPHNNKSLEKYLPVEGFVWKSELNPARTYLLTTSECDDFVKVFEGLVEFWGDEHAPLSWLVGFFKTGAYLAKHLRIRYVNNHLLPFPTWWNSRV